MGAANARRGTCVEREKSGSRLGACLDPQWLAWLVQIPFSWIAPFHRLIVYLTSNCKNHPHPHRD